MTLCKVVQIEYFRLRKLFHHSTHRPPQAYLVSYIIFACSIKFVILSSLLTLKSQTACLEGTQSVSQSSNSLCVTEIIADWPVRTGKIGFLGHLPSAWKIWLENEMVHTMPLETFQKLQASSFIKAFFLSFVNFSIIDASAFCDISILCLDKLQH